MLTILLTVLLYQAPPAEEAPPWKPFKTQRDVEESPKKKLMRVGGVSAVGVGVGGALLGSALAAGAAMVVAVSGQLLTASDVLVQTDRVGQARNGLMLVAGLASGVFLISSVFIGVGVLTAILGMGAFLYSLLLPT